MIAVDGQRDRDVVGLETLTPAFHARQDMKTPLNFALSRTVGRELRAGELIIGTSDTLACHLLPPVLAASLLRIPTVLHEQNGVIGLEGIDTRALVRRIRVRGAMTGVLSTTTLDDAALVLAGGAAEERPFNLTGFTSALADEIVQLWLATPFDGGRHERRIGQIADIEREP